MFVPLISVTVKVTGAALPLRLSLGGIVHWPTPSVVQPVQRAATASVVRSVGTSAAPRARKASAPRARTAESGGTAAPQPEPPPRLTGPQIAAMLAAKRKQIRGRLNTISRLQARGDITSADFKARVKRAIPTTRI